MYQALYRKYRPVSFEDVLSQPHITKTLINQIKNKKTAHAYLFTGTRGTGKTTCARILAKAVNCKNPENGNPCLECDICKDAEASVLSDIIEIDAASNNGVDDIRELRDGAVYTPERCKYKVYIIDEVHMLSVNAFNALLKIMEEPPEYVKFILATTEVQKVPATILSRVQRFDFRRIRSEDIKSRLLYVADREKIRLADDAAELIAKIADGGMRDALSLLDQCIAYSEDVVLDTVLAAAGIAGRDYIFELIEAIIDKKISDVLEIIDKLYSMSKDIQRLCEELILQIRNLMIIKTSPDRTDLIKCIPDEIKKLDDYAKKLSIDEILNLLSILQECNEKLTRSLTKRIDIEMCMIKLCTKSKKQTVDNSEIYAKIEQLEDKIKTNPVLPAEKKQKANVSEPKEKADETVDLSKLRLQDFNSCGLWTEVLEEFEKVSPSVSGTLKNSKAYINQNIMLIDAENEFFLKLFKQKENAEQLLRTIEHVLGKKYIVRARSSKGKAEVQDNTAKKLLLKAEQNGIPVESE